MNKKIEGRLSDEPPLGVSYEIGIYRWDGNDVTTNECLPRHVRREQQALRDGERASHDVQQASRGEERASHDEEQAYVRDVHVPQQDERDGSRHRSQVRDDCCHLCRSRIRSDDSCRRVSGDRGCRHRTPKIRRARQPDDRSG